MTAEQDEAARQFIRHLNELHRRVGKPSYSMIEQASTHKLIKSTVSDILNGKRTRVPSWRFVSGFVTVCHHIAEDTGLDPMRLGNVNGWKVVWDDARDGRVNPDFPGLDDLLSEPAHPPNENPEKVKPPLVSPILDSFNPVNVDQPDLASIDPTGPEIIPLHGPLPRGVHDFVGRESLLSEIHQIFTADIRDSALTVQGLSGIGKTQLAIAYARQYAAHYDLVWWISCETRNLAYRDMASLESRLGLSHVPTSPQQPRFTAVFDTLRRGTPYARWLLIFDNADVPDNIEEYIPPGHGHILITSRSNIWDRSGQLLEVGVFTRNESVEFLRNRMRGLSEADAHRIAEATGDLPLALEHAAVSRISIEDYLSQLETQPFDLFSANQPPGYPLPVAEVWRQTIERLQSEPDAVQLLHCMAFFGSRPIPLDLLDKGRYLPEVSLQAMLRETIRRSRAIMSLRHAGLLDLGSMPTTLLLHRLTQSIVRDMLEPEEAEQYKHDVHLLLGAADPDNPYDPDSWDMYDELRGHMGWSDIEGCRHESVRRLVVNVVGCLNASGNPSEARTLADKALSRWTASAGDDDASNDFDATASILAMRRAKADALFSLCDYRYGLELSEAVLDEVRADPTRWWPEEAIIAGRMDGTRHRIMGEFGTALEADRGSVLQHISELAYDHPQTFVATNSLVVDNTLNGNYYEAARLAEKNYHDCRAFYPGNHPAVFFYQNSVACSMRFSGQYSGALGLAEGAHDGYRSAIGYSILNDKHPWVLTNEIDLAAARRDVGHIDEAFEGFASQARDVHQACWQAFGVDHQHTLAAALMLGSLLRRIPGRIDEAATEVANTQRRYGATLGENHPYTHACSIVLAGIRRLDGAAAEAIALLERAIVGLEGTVGASHPLTLNAIATLVNALTDEGNPGEAVARGEEALGHFRHVLGPDHPDTLGCAANVTAALLASSRSGEAESLRADTLERYNRTLGGDHPSTQCSARGGCLDPDFTPLPL